MPTGVRIKNIDNTDFGTVTVKLNLRNMGGDDGEANAGSLERGRSVTIPYGEFTVGTERFSPSKTKILTVFVKNNVGSTKLFLCPSRKCQPS